MSVKILVVDDEPKLQQLIRQLFRRQIRRQEFQFYFAENGQEALETLKAERDIDIILTDINMPKMDGLTLLAKLQEIKPEINPALIPIVISAYADMENVRKVMHVGGFDFLTKPIDLDDLKHTVEHTIEHAQLLKETIEQKRQAEEALHQLNEELEARVNSRTAELQATNEALQASNQELDAFAYMVAHDLKNPLSLMMGYLDMLINHVIDMEDEYLIELVKEALQSGSYMNNIINELLLLARVRRKAVETSPFDMSIVIDNVLTRLTSIIQQYQGQIVQPQQWPRAMGYAPWIEEVWVNYISNGLKYGGPSPHLTLGFDELPDGTISFWIEDKGPGIPPEAQSKLFAEFIRLKGSAAEGHGLGLSIVRRIIDKLDGTVGVESEVGHGCKFYFTLPQVT